MNVTNPQMPSQSQFQQHSDGSMPGAGFQVSSGLAPTTERSEFNPMPGNVMQQDDQEIVSFLDEGMTATSAVPYSTNMAQTLETPAREDRIHDVVAYLERPYKILGVTWKTTDVQLTELFAIDFPDTLFAQPGIRQKLEGFALFRAGLQIRVQTNAQPFQQGRMLIVFVPYRSMMTNNPSSVRTLQGLTGYPHIDLDLADTQNAVLDIPFIAPVSHLNLNDRIWSIGTVYGFVYSPLAGGSETEIDCTVWSRFTDVDVQMPTGAPLYAPVIPTGQKIESNLLFVEAQVGDKEVRTVRFDSDLATPLVTRSLETLKERLFVLSGILLRAYGLINRVANESEFPEDVKEHIFISITCLKNLIGNFRRLVNNCDGAMFCDVELLEQEIVFGSKTEILKILKDCRSQIKALQAELNNNCKFITPIEHIALRRELNKIFKNNSVLTSYVNIKFEIELPSLAVEAQVGGAVSTGLNFVKDNKESIISGTKAVAETAGHLKDTARNAEQVSKSSGTWGKVAFAGAAIAGAAALIPVCTPIAAPIAAGLAAVGSVLSIFGWSKPNSVAPIMPMIQQTARYGTNYDGIDMSKILALDSKNALAREPIFGSGIDEMAINYVTSTPCYQEEFNFKFSDAPGSVLAVIPVCPQKWTFYDSASYPNVYAMTLLHYASMFFTYWRGGIRFSFRFVKTRFHSGRVRIIYVPHGLMPNGTPKTIDPDKCYSEIVDLRERSEFHFEVPYINEVPWIALEKRRVGPAPPRNTGCVLVQVLNELRGPTTLVSDTVPVLVEVSSAEDFEFGKPRAFSGTLINNMNGAPVAEKKPKIVKGDTSKDRCAYPTGENLKVEAQVGGSTASPREVTQLHNDRDTKKMFKTSEGINNDINFNSMGEIVRSFKQLLNRIQASTVLDALDMSKWIFVSPWSIGADEVKDSNLLVRFNHVSNYAALSAIYAFQRGGRRAKFDTPFAYNQMIQTAIVSENQGGVDTRNPISFGNDLASEFSYKGTCAVSQATRDGQFEIEMPYYRKTLLEANYFNDYHDLTNSLNMRNYATAVNLQGGSKADRVPYNIWFNCADDFQFGFLIGAPLVGIS
jgi:hypothetical protein